MEGLKIILIIGNTGSGKSTTASYLMGAKMIKFEN
jgi:adenylate kinase family enzyme